MKFKELLLTILILGLSIYYYRGNFNKLEYVYNKAFATSHKDSAIVRVEIKSPSFSTRKSFVKDVVRDKQGRYIVFMRVPQGVDKATIARSISIDGFEAQGQSINAYVLRAVHGDIVAYIINDHYAENLALLIEENKF